MTRCHSERVRRGSVAFCAAGQSGQRGSVSAYPQCPWSFVPGPVETCHDGMRRPRVIHLIGLIRELRIALSLARLRVSQDRHIEAKQILTPVYKRFTDGYETTDLRIARAMLDGLAS